MALKTMLDQLRAAQNAVRDNAAQAIAVYFKPFLVEGYELRWDQHTPYFNDGEPCVFRTGEVYLVQTSADPDGRDSNYDLEQQGHACNLFDAAPNGFSDDAWKSIQALQEAWEDLAKQAGAQRDYNTNEPSGFEAFLKSAFGDHCVVRIKSDGSFGVIADTNHD